MHTLGVMAVLLCSAALMYRENDCLWAMQIPCSRLVLQGLKEATSQLLCTEEGVAACHLQQHHGDRYPAAV